MRISAISNFSAECRKPHFNGQWETKTTNHNWDDSIKKIYVPDKNESLTSIAEAWRDETGELPCDWVTLNNPYNQNSNDVQYEIKNYPYIPVNLLIASAKIKTAEADWGIEKMASYVQLAKLNAQLNNKKQVNIYEQKMEQTLKNDIFGAKYQTLAAGMMNEYKDGFGSNTLARAIYGK